MIEIRNPESKELASIFELLDNEFVYSRNRIISIKQRYPDLFSEKNFHNLFSLFQDSVAVSFLAAREANIVFSGNCYKVYFIGAVFTKKEFRGKGLGSLLLKRADEIFLQRKFDAGLLWTSLPEYYSRLGWKQYQSGFFVTCSGKVSAGQTRQLEYFDMKEFDKNLLFELWKRNYKAEIKLERDIDFYNTWLTLPLPSEKCNVIFKKDCGYLIYGTYNDVDYLYEMVSINDSARNELFRSWLDINNSKIYYLNLDNDTITDKIFLEKFFKNVDYKLQNIGMYKTQVRDFKEIITNTPVPYLDRI